MAGAVPRTVADLLRAAAQAEPDAVGLVDAGRRWTWRELDARTDERAAGLLEAGLRRGDRLAVQLPGGADFVTSYLAGLRAGLVVVPINPAYTLPELRHVLVDSGAAMLVTSSMPAAEAFTEPAKPVQVVIAGAAPAGTRALADVAAEPLAPAKAELGQDVEPEDTAVLLYTSGTSGLPKGAMLSHRALLANLEQIGRITPPLLTAADIALVPLPLFHVFGLNAGLGLALASRARLVTLDRFDADRAVQLAKDEHVTVALGAPGMFAALLAHPGLAAAFVDVRLALAGSAPLPAELVARYTDLGIPLHEGYGLSETAPVVTTNAVDADGRSRVGRPTPGSIGLPIPGVAVEIRDADGEPVDDADPGQLAVRGANLFSGYWPDGHGGPDADGWFVTGDIGYADATGELHLVGRDTDMVLVNGFNVYPAEVESVLRESEDVAAVAVVGVPDEVTGEAVRAYVVPAAGGRVDPDALLARAARSLARFKLPQSIELVESLPLTATGKVKKWQLKTTA
jgi:long-chain acyl-CoA synthetase